MLRTSIAAATFLALATPAWAVALAPVAEHGEHKKMKKEPKQDEAEEHNKKEHGEEKKD